MEKARCVFIATPFGAGGPGGIDRLTDLVVAGLAERPSLGIHAVRLVTRGRYGLTRGAFFFAAAIARLCLAAKSGRIDLLHINLAAGGSAYRKALLARCAKRLGIP